MAQWLYQTNKNFLQLVSVAPFGQSLCKHLSFCCNINLLQRDEQAASGSRNQSFAIS
jgi:hypothetical protein